LCVLLFLCEVVSRRTYGFDMQLQNRFNSIPLPGKGEILRQEGTSGGAHTYSTEEVRAFSEHFNEVLADDASLSKWLALDPNSEKMFDAVAEGVLLAKYINKIRPGAIMEKKLATKPRNTFEISQNHVLTLEAAKEIGLKIVNIGPTDLITKTPHLVLGLTWQLIRLGLLDKVSVAKQPGLVALLEPGEDVNALISLTPEETLLRWFNYHLRRAGHHRHVHNFTTDIQDSENYLVLLNQINPDLCVLEAMQESDPLKRAEHMLHNAAKLDCNKFVTPHEVITGHKKLNLAFVANLFNRHAGLQTLEQDAERQRLQKEAEEAQKRRLAEEEEARKRAWEAEQEMWRKRMKEEEARRQAELAEWERKQKEAEAEEARRRAWEA